jgi:serine/threonine protein phosphatase PrpC
MKRNAETEAPMLVSAATSCSAGLTGNDRDALVSVENRQVLIVADGAQGRQGGVAADIVIAYVRDHAAEIAGAMSCSASERALTAIDQQIYASGCGGLTTAVLVVLEDNILLGASVGDSEAHLIRQGDVVDLTADQPRRPFLGSGSAKPASFGPIGLEGRLLVATDGLFKYGKAEVRERIVRTAPIREVAWRLADSVRLRNGHLQDDVTVYVVERRDETVLPE